MQNSTLQCPACGSTEIDTTDVQREVRVPFAPARTITETVSTCRVCGESGDFASVNDERVKLAVSESVKLSIPSMFDALGRHGISLAYFERALDLPARTAARWKSGECSAAPVALLRIATTFPWMLEVAASGFDQVIAEKKVVAEAIRILHTLADTKNVGYSVAVTASGTSANVNISLVADNRAPHVPQLVQPQASVARIDRNS